ncbi:hypothetical protein FOPG_16219 [Fusarium oxysporum f. sp. conglutinans race 2 54008]|uniref:Uncharacterized protein n=3 Tax=Fusarium oxysporum TaxID=5507 RepID=F9FDW1_FUSOF|nr:hypothetical protein FOXB_04589 [Fusarium oxysporum f. sp. conglutinans Fo5176]EXA33888.1 hypothetical protein FOVG_15180 [Fusarium oxysporum f. sp. pisi HDV247]EXL67674.1 hypothetical protein FOPG_16219 [Fusarium oxysporum f. sp. conglutinans race 2 54008]KAI8412328.1 hypothetical protein FOFC_05585 [Fusarium oxysporum]WKT42166.1 hypothetical protein QSH57_006972 [Fusarium oxysporum f. sp. vasinfectum]
MSDEQPVPENHIEESQFDDNAIQNTVYVKWDVKGGRDRTHDANLNTCTQLEGSPNIQGIEIKSAVNVSLYCYGGTSCSGSPDVFEGPTNGKLKINPERYGAYKLVPR